MNFTFKAVSEPECKNFLKVKKNDTYFTIDEFIITFKSDSEEILSDCSIKYRESEMSYQQMIDEYVAFSESLEFYPFQEQMLIVDTSIRSALYFANKAADCLQTARFFAMKGALLLDIDFNLHWADGYVPQYLFRCINFGTASTWYSNSFDHILQIAYWGLHLHTSVTDRDDNIYDDSWDAKKTMGLCTYDFVVAELKARKLTEIRNSLTSCSGKIEEVRKWANYIKHKGGIDYKYLEAEKPYKVYITPVEEGQAVSPAPKLGDKLKLPDEQFAINDFKSPVEIDIDEKLPTLIDAHVALHKCLGEIIAAVDFDGNAVKFSTKEEQDNGQA